MDWSCPAGYMCFDDGYCVLVFSDSEIVVDLVGMDLWDMFSIDVAAWIVLVGSLFV